jgi:hypothetical protein
MLVQLAKKVETEKFSTIEDLTKLKPNRAKNCLMTCRAWATILPIDRGNQSPRRVPLMFGCGRLGKLFFDKEPEDKRKAISRIKNEGLRRWGK